MNLPKQKTLSRTILDEIFAMYRYGLLIRFKEYIIKSHSFIIDVFPGILHEKKFDKLCLMAHYDFQGRIDPYVIFYIRKLSEEGFDVVLISTSEVLDDSDIKEALKYCRGIIHRKNVGIDFASWKAAMGYIPDVWTYNRILLANDSVFGPFTSLKEVFRKFEESPAMVCGLTDNSQIGYHLQSYFLYFKKEIILNPIFIDFWNKVRPKYIKSEIIEQYEVGLSMKLIASNFTLFSLYEYEEIKKYINMRLPEHQFITDLNTSHPINQIECLWDVLLKYFDFPFIKKESLVTNSKLSSAVIGWEKLIPESGRELVPIVCNYLERVKKNNKLN